MRKEPFPRGYALTGQSSCNNEDAQSLLPWPAVSLLRSKEVKVRFGLREHFIGWSSEEILSLHIQCAVFPITSVVYWELLESLLCMFRQRLATSGAWGIWCVFFYTLLSQKITFFYQVFSTAWTSLRFLSSSLSIKNCHLYPNPQCLKFIKTSVFMATSGATESLPHLAGCNLISEKT